MLLFAIYPIFFTGYVAFTNYGDGHLLTKEQALTQILSETYLPEEGKAYTWTAYKSDAGTYALWLQDNQGVGYLAMPGEEIRSVEPGQAGVGELDAKGIPEEIEGYQRLNAILATTDQDLPQIQFGAIGQTVQVRSPSEAAELEPLYFYDEIEDALTSQQTGETFYQVFGTYTTHSGETIKPGFRAQVGWKNFKDFFVSPALRGPLVRIMIWNFIFPTVSVLSTFALGLAIAIMFNEKDFPAKKLIRSLLIIPYTIPSLITIIIWRGMMNPEVGIINRVLETSLGASVPWFTDPLWAKIAILIVNLWLGYPYFMLICSGALQSIPTDLYAAAEVDGANAWHRFWNITLPLLLVAVGPLLIASFVFNFNNFNLIFLFIQGGPPIAGASTRAGHTDILISYVYSLVFQGGRGVRYGLASAVTIVIFLIVAAITLIQFRYTNMWEEVSENV
jgi:ABC-type sugar transport system permease subunit